MFPYLNLAFDLAIYSFTGEENLSDFSKDFQKISFFDFDNWRSPNLSELTQLGSEASR